MTVGLVWEICVVSLGEGIGMGVVGQLFIAFSFRKSFFLIMIHP